MVRGATTASIVEDGENGFLCDDTPEDLARVITRAITDPDALKKAGEGAKKTISIPWEQTMEKAVKRYEDLIELGKKGKLKDKSKRLL
jgi:glycosyltransferase involved in cell wall biosynthesis